MERETAKRKPKSDTFCVQRTVCDMIKKVGEDLGKGKQRISIRASGKIGINKDATAEFLDEEEYAVLYYDEEGNNIFIELVNKESEPAYKITRANNSGTISCQSFINSQGLASDESRKYIPEKTTIEYDGEAIDVLEINVDEPVD